MADKDTIIVLLQKNAVKVAEYVRKILKRGKEARCGLYKELDIPMDKIIHEVNN